MYKQIVIRCKFIADFLLHQHFARRDPEVLSRYASVTWTLTAGGWCSAFTWVDPD